MLTSFDKYLNIYSSTEVPLIQRDYVQGSDYWSDKRDKFMNDLLAALQSGVNKIINFIYGTNSGNNKKHFIPLDGQQRLTSLNLLGWMLLQAARLKDRTVDSTLWRDGLGLSYQTRASSQEFCVKLLQSDLADFEEEPSKQIKGSLWFAESWIHDPTIVAMLEMLNYIWQQLKPYEKDWIGMAERFFSDSPIEFELLEIENRDPDDLYIKINARGKALTEFEHWKAWFIGKLGNNGSLKKEFETKIETSWCNYFWGFAKVNAGNVTYPRIDEYFMRFFAFVTDFLGAFSNFDDKSYSEYLKDRNNEGARRLIEKVYFSSSINNDKIQLLFELLDTLPLIGNLSDYLFSTIDPCDPLIAVEKTKVNIFGGAENLDLLYSLLNGDNLDLSPKFLLWGVIRYVALYGNSQLQDFIRVWWGIIMNIRQRNADGFEVNSNLRYNKLCEWEEVLNIILKDSDPFVNTSKLTSKGTLSSWLRYNSTTFHKNHIKCYDEDIVRLQNHPWLLYDTHVLDSLIFDPAIPVGDVFNRFYNQFVTLKGKKQVKVLLEHGFNGCKPKSDYLTYGFAGNWAYILTDDEAPAATPLYNLLKGANPIAPKKWPSDFIYKYYGELKKMPDNLAFYIDKHKGILFGSKKSLRKQGYIMEPYNYVTAILAGLSPYNGKVVVTYGTSGIADEITLFNENSTHYGICFQAYKLQMEPVKHGWKLSSYDNGSDPDVKIPTTGFTTRFGIPGAWTDKQGVFTINAEGFVVKLPGKDRVETGVQLLKTLIQLL